MPKLREHCRAHRDERYASVEDADREAIFDDFVRELKESEAKAKAERSKKRADAYVAFLAEVGDDALLALAPPPAPSSAGENKDAPGLNATWESLRWSKVDDFLRAKNDDRYKNISSESRKREFEALRKLRVDANGGPTVAPPVDRSRDKKASRRDKRSRSRDRSRRDASRDGHRRDRSDRDRDDRSRDRRDRDRDRRDRSRDRGRR